VAGTITILLLGRATYLTGRTQPGWRSGDVHDLFMAYVVPRQVDAWDLADHGPTAIRDYLRFLDVTDRLSTVAVRQPAPTATSMRCSVPCLRAQSASATTWDGLSVASGRSLPLIPGVPTAVPARQIAASADVPVSVSAFWWLSAMCPRAAGGR
jgi:hypothetical protein